jgi:hypothetical protein
MTSGAPVVEDIDGARAARTVLSDRADAYYSRLFGWSSRWHDRRLFLVLENGLCAVTIPKLTSARLLDNLARTGCQGPILDLPTPRGARLAILADADGLVPARDSLARDVELLHSGAVLPLPMKQWFQQPSVEWFRAPDPRQRWLPSLTAVLAGVQSYF